MLSYSQCKFQQIHNLRPSRKPPQGGILHVKIALYKGVLGI
jgi:hypothetical protein